MKNLLFFAFSSAVAGFIGYKVGYNISKKHYETLADIEVESIKKVMEERYKDAGNVLPPSNTPSMPKTNDPLNKEQTPKKPGTVDYSKPYRTTSEPDRIPGKPFEKPIILEKEKVDTTKPYVISPEDFRDSEYEAVELRYTSDKVLTDDEFNPIKNIGMVGGHVLLNQMGKYEPDCLHVRDDAKAVDYEILKDERTYDQIRPFGGVVNDQD